MLSPARRREAVLRICAEVGVSERQACRAVGQHRSTQRYVGIMLIDKTHLVTRVKQLAAEHPRYGYRRITALLRREGWQVNHKRVHRIWREEHLKPLAHKKKLRVENLKEKSAQPIRATRKNEIWAWDITIDRSLDGERLEWLAIVDEFTRECLALEVRTEIKEWLLVERFGQLTSQRGCPRFIRSDNGALFNTATLHQVLASSGVTPLVVPPASPWNNGIVESFLRRLRDELLDCEVYGSLAEAQEAARHWREHYNRLRPHGSLKNLTPLEFTASTSHTDSTENNDAQ